MIFNAVQFIVYGQAKEAIGHGEILSLPNTFLAGAITGVAVTFVETPMDLFKSQLQVQIIRAKDNPEYKAQFTSVSGAIKQIIKTNGILGCWQGFMAGGVAGVAYWGCIYPLDIVKVSEAAVPDA